MAKSETGWTKEWPNERGFYWARETPDDMNILLVEIHANRLTICGGTKLNVKEAFENSEFLGPLSPSDAEQLVELRKLAQDADELIVKLYDADAIPTLMQYEVDGLRGRLHKANNPSHLQKEKVNHDNAD